MPHSRSSKSSQHIGTLTLARIQLLVIFVVMGGLDCITYLLTHPSLQHRVLGGCLVNVIWSTVCIIAMWMRHDWARYFLVIRLLFSVVMAGWSELSYSALAPSPRILIAASITLSHLAVAVFLIASPKIRKLTSPYYHPSSF